MKVQIIITEVQASGVENWLKSQEKNGFSFIKAEDIKLPEITIHQVVIEVPLDWFVQDILNAIGLDGWCFKVNEDGSVEKLIK